jgi:hypothetical protein
MRFDHQKELMLHLKVTGRSYLESGPTDKLPAESIEMKEFCSRYDCDKLQSAVIRFNLVE